jgi:putative membrane protein (TIGR04086 family)
MQFDPRQTGKPLPPVQPTGFFTGVQIRPVIIGVVVDYVATLIGIYAYFFMYLPYELSKQGEVSSEAINDYMMTTEGLLIGFVIGTLGTAIGGFVAARKAGNFEIKHGAFVGLGSLIVSFIEQLMQQEFVPLPEWFRFLSVVAIIPAGALGGYVAELFKGSGGARPPSSGKLPGS